MAVVVWGLCSAVVQGALTLADKYGGMGTPKDQSLVWASIGRFGGMLGTPSQWAEDKGYPRDTAWWGTTSGWGVNWLLHFSFVILLFDFQTL